MCEGIDEVIYADNLPLVVFTLSISISLSIARNEKRSHDDMRVLLIFPTLTTIQLDIGPSLIRKKNRGYIFDIFAVRGAFDQNIGFLLCGPI